MSLFKLRPLALGCFAFLACLYLSYFLGNIFNIIIIALGALTLVTLVALTIALKRDKIEKWLIRLLPLCLCIIICGACSIFVFSSDKKIENEYAGTEREMELLVTEIVYSEEYESVAKAKTNSENKNFKILLSVDNNKIAVGDKIKATFKIRSLYDSKYGYSESEHYMDERIFLCAETEKYEVISSDNFVLGAFFRRINSFLVKIVNESVNSDTASLISAMLLGNRDALGDNVSRDFSRLGISHILALSGIHLSLVTAMASTFFSAIQMPKKPRYVLLILMILTFVCITGFSRSALRAGIMLILYYTMLLLGDTSDGATALFASASLICLFDPYSIFSLSLLLSFTAMLACICAGALTKHERKLYRIRPKRFRAVIYTLITSVAVMLLTLPIVFIRFGGVSIFAPVFNIVFVPLLTILLYLSPFVLILGKIPYVSYIVKYPAEILTKFVLFLTGNISKSDFLSISFSSDLQLIGVYVILIGMLLAIILSKKRLKISVITVVLGVLIFAGTTTYVSILRNNQITINDYSAINGDITTVESKNEIMVLSSAMHNTGIARESADFATSLGYSDIDTYVFTDYSHNIVNAVDKVTNSYMIRKIMLPSPETDKEKEQYDAIKALCESKGIPACEIGERLEFGQTCVDFMEYQRLGRSTKRCVAYSVSAYNARFTYLGASSYECGSRFPQNYAKISDVIVFGSYGPPYKLSHTYDIPSADYLVFHGDSRDFLILDIDDDMVVRENAKFIFKRSVNS